MLSARPGLDSHPPNPRVSAPHSAVTARAYCDTRLARGRARYAVR
jgi:hypothetical protein